MWAIIAVAVSPIKISCTRLLPPMCVPPAVRRVSVIMSAGSSVVVSKAPFGEVL
ncbi:MAG: hypothetical protein FWG87_07385 [Defluviitaleaceae bacterium]|nr:hypothetical protein [Defluviitaleaceae bacterium]